MSAEYWFNKLIEGEKIYDDFDLLQDGYWGLKRVSKTNCLSILPRVIPLFNSDNRYARWHAAMIPGLIGPGAEEAIPGLRDLLSDEYNNARREAAISLGKIGASSWVAIDELAKLFDDPDRTIAYHAVTALANIGEPSFKYYDRIAGFLDDNDFIHPYARDAAIRFVTMYPEHAPSGVEMKLIGIVQNPRLRGAEEHNPASLAAVALTKFSNSNEYAVVPLMNLLKSDVPEYYGTKHFGQHVSAAYALSKMGDMAEPAIDALISELFNLNVAELYVDYEDAYTPVGKWFTVSELCAEALGNIGDAAVRAVPELERLAEIDGERYGLSDAQETRVQAAAREAIAKIASD
ncbi:MAG: HEAT repeat domain-containing protein [Planctomycetes bacterium]|nr:HEAT repeat domain-containing protein [Planctomycetota bacterium]